MSYTLIAVLAVIAVVTVDLVVLRTRLLLRVDFWIAYAIMFFFQLLIRFGVLKAQSSFYLSCLLQELQPFLGILGGSQTSSQVHQTGLSRPYAPKFFKEARIVRLKSQCLLKVADR